MKILVCVKQVPGSSNVEVDPVTGVLKRSGIPSKINPYDLYALETALEMKERFSGEVTTLTMGPPQAKAVIEESVCMGAASGTVLTDRRFAGADVLATAKALSEGIKHLGDFDVIVCGKQTTDGDTAQVGSEVAEMLGIPSVAGVISVESFENGCVTLTSIVDSTVTKMKVKTPCLISTDSDINTPRLPSYKIKKSLSNECVTLLSLDALGDKDPSHYGLMGSATQVERIFPPEKNTEKQMLTGNGEALAEKLFAVLSEKKIV